MSPKEQVNKYATTEKQPAYQRKGDNKTGGNVRGGRDKAKGEEGKVDIRERKVCVPWGTVNRRQ